MPRKRRALPSQREVVDAALLVVDDVGVEGLTIRSVSSASGLPTMTLYKYFQSKRQLLELMSLEVSSRFFTVPVRSSWRAALEGLCHHVRALALAHPTWLALVDLRALSASATTSLLVDARTRAALPPAIAARAALDAALLSLGHAQLQLSFAQPKSFLPPAARAVGTDWDGTFAATVARWVAGVEAEAQNEADSTASPLPASRSHVTSLEVATSATTSPPSGAATTLGAPPVRGIATIAPGG